MSKFTDFVRANKFKSVVAGTAVAAVVAVSGGMASQALFTSSDNTAAYAASGHVELHVTQHLSVANVLPGVDRSAAVTFDNTKSSAPVELSLSKVSAPSVKNPNGGDVSQLTVKLVDSQGKTVVGPVPFSQLASVAPTDLHVQVAAGQSWTGSFVFSLPATADNTLQDAAVYYNAVTFTGTQILP